MKYKWDIFMIYAVHVYYSGSTFVRLKQFFTLALDSIINNSKERYRNKMETLIYPALASSQRRVNKVFNIGGPKKTDPNFPSKGAQIIINGANLRNRQ